MLALVQMFKEIATEARDREPYFFMGSGPLEVESLPPEEQEVDLVIPTFVRADGKVVTNFICRGVVDATVFRTPPHVPSVEVIMQSNKEN